mmetsp:Transcript_17090/g.42809  ORF Transcript_17090/g.42809 Transcript_17090/m.42809 type:complete len:231 (+) Transcript_17090:2531-3223(+)
MAPSPSRSVRSSSFCAALSVVCTPRCCSPSRSSRRVNRPSPSASMARKMLARPTTSSSGRYAASRRRAWRLNAFMPLNCCSRATTASGTCRTSAPRATAAATAAAMEPLGTLALAICVCSSAAMLSGWHLGRVTDATGDALGKGEGAGGEMVPAHVASQGCASSSLMVARCLGSLVSSRRMKSLASSDTSAQAAPLNLGSSARMDFHSCDSAGLRRFFQSSNGNLPLSSW